MRGLSSLLLMIVLALLLYPLPHGVILIGIMTLSLLSHTLGIISLGILALYLIVFRITNIVGVAIMALGLLVVEIREMEKIRAPMEHFLYLIVAVGLSLLTYFGVYAISLAGVSLDVTLLAVLFLLLLYAFIRISVLSP